MEKLFNSLKRKWVDKKKGLNKIGGFGECLQGVSGMSLVRHIDPSNDMAHTREGFLFN